MPLIIDVVYSSTETAVSVAGEVDMAAATSLRDSIIDASAAQPGWPLTIDFTAVSLLDAAGMTALIQAYRQAHRHNVAVTVTNVQPLVMAVLEIVDLVDFLGATARSAD